MEARIHDEIDKVAYSDVVGGGVHANIDMGRYENSRLTCRVEMEIGVYWENQCPLGALFVHEKLRTFRNSGRSVRPLLRVTISAQRSCFHSDILTQMFEKLTDTKCIISVKRRNTARSRGLEPPNRHGRGPR